MKLLTLAVVAVALMSVQAHACGARADGTLITQQTRDQDCRLLPDSAKGTSAVQTPAVASKSADAVASPVKTK